MEDSLKSLQHLFKADVDPRRVAAIIFEPVQGEGGFNVAPPAFVEALRALCDEHGILLVADEVQTGFGRTGSCSPWSTTAWCRTSPPWPRAWPAACRCRPCGRAEVMDAPAPGGLGGTYAGNPLAVASALAVLDVLEAEQLPARGALLGERLVARLQALQPRVPQIAEVRGLGAMVAVEFRQADGSPDAAFTREVQNRALERGLLLLSCGVYGNVIRFLFPLTIPDGVMEEGLDILADVLTR